MQERYYLCVVPLNSICMVRFVAGFITLTLGLLTVLKKSIKKSLQSVADYLDSASRSQRQQHFSTREGQWTSDDLKLPECKIIYNKLSTGLNTPVDYLLLGALVRTQQLIIESRIETDLARETSKWHNSQPPNIPPPIKTEHRGVQTPFSLRLQSPWTTKQNNNRSLRDRKTTQHKAV